MNYPIIDVEATGENIARLRLQRGLSVKDLQAALGFATPQAIYKWQKGQSLPTLDNLVILSEILNVSIDNILVVR
ncbi:MAG: helix-turn-helix transcriptional regulator [Clostridia bacterium]|nr:helix-turn-helix transcriptional regulator [Clostridia bacterium]